MNTKVRMAAATALWIKEVGQLEAEESRAEIQKITHQELRKKETKE